MGSLTIQVDTQRQHESSLVCCRRDGAWGLGIYCAPIREGLVDVLEVFRRISGMMSPSRVMVRVDMVVQLSSCERLIMGGGQVHGQRKG